VDDPLRAPLEIEFDYTRSLGPVLSQFMTGLRDRRILGARGADGRVHAPIAFARYLSGLRNAEEAASWQAYLNTLPKGGVGCDANCQVHMLNMGKWRANGAERSGMPKPN